MKKLMVAAVASVMMISTPVFAEKAPAPVKIGVLDMREVMQNSSELKQHQEAMQKEFGPRLEEIQAKDKSMRASIEKFQRDMDVMSESERTKLENEIQASQQELVTMQNAYQQESNAKQQQVMQDFISKIKSEAGTYAKEKNYDLIVFSEAALFSNPQFEVTKDIMKRLG